MLKLVKTRQYWFILCVQLILYFMTPFMGYHNYLALLFIACLFGVFGTVISSIWGARSPRIIAIICMITVVILAVIGHLPGARMEVYLQCLTASCFMFAIFIFIAIISIGKDVLVDQKDSFNAILGSICIFIFIGYFFTFIFAGLGLLVPESMHVYSVFTPLHADAFADYMYFSFSTLTTVGFGDITATKPITRMVAAFESVVGVLYIAIMISRLVSLHAAEKGGSNT